MHWHSTHVIFHSLGSPIDCGAPPTPASGVTVKPYNATTVSSVCGEDERWSSDPSKVVCVMIPGMLGRFLILLCSHSLWSVEPKP